VIYPQLLKADFDKLPRALRDFHSLAGDRKAAGKVAVQRERGWFARLVGFPQAGENIPARLEVSASQNREVWIRRFGNGVLRSAQWAEGDLLVETAGPLRIYFRVTADVAGLRFESLRARLWGIPVPVRIAATARGGDSAWEFEVKFEHVGSYRGSMEQVP
jgi:hypothetical protein